MIIRVRKHARSNCAIHPYFVRASALYYKTLAYLLNSKLSEFQLGSFEAVFPDEAKQIVKNMLNLSGETAKK